MLFLMMCVMQMKLIEVGVCDVDEVDVVYVVDVKDI